MIQQTTNYDMFKKHPRNREIDEGNVQKILRSIKFKNLLRFQPILIDSENRVIDGQHRLECARRLQIPVYYDSQAGLEAEDIAQLNANKKGWGMDDYLNFYEKAGIGDYVRLRRFMKNENLNLRAALTAFGINVGDFGEMFRTGRFKYPSPDCEIEALDILYKTKKTLEYIEPKLEASLVRFTKGPRFQRALFLLFSCKAVDLDVFLNKLGFCLEKLRPAVRLAECVKMLQDIYNWKNKSQINLLEAS